MAGLSLSLSPITFHVARSMFYVERRTSNLEPRTSARSPSLSAFAIVFFPCPCHYPYRLLPWDRDFLQDLPNDLFRVIRATSGGIPAAAQDDAVGQRGDGELLDVVGDAVLTSLGEG